MSNAINVLKEGNRRNRRRRRRRNRINYGFFINGSITFGR
tara:strand:- start:87 stop:206 length:120 start_codon:yes stop_codon:yes gene_type:complete